MNENLVSAVFDNAAEAERAVSQLRSAGVSDSAISIIAQQDGKNTTTDGSGAEAATDVIGKTALGAGAGTLLGIAALAIPGVGPLVAAGAIASAAIPGAALTGAAIGAAAGGLDRPAHRPWRRRRRCRILRETASTTAACSCRSTPAMPGSTRRRRATSSTTPAATAAAAPRTPPPLLRRGTIVSNGAAVNRPRRRFMNDAATPYCFRYPMRIQGLGSVGAAVTNLEPEAIADLGADPEIQALLGRVCELTGMGFAAVAHVSETRWIACQVDDRVAFGLKPGDELEIKKTICDDIRASGRAIAIDNTAADPDWWNHPVPVLYGFHILRLAADRHRRRLLRHLVRDRRRPARALASAQSSTNSKPWRCRSPSARARLRARPS